MGLHWYFGRATAEKHAKYHRQMLPAEKPVRPNHSKISDTRRTYTARALCLPWSLLYRATSLLRLPYRRGTVKLSTALSRIGNGLICHFATQVPPNKPPSGLASVRVGLSRRRNLGKLGGVRLCRGLDVSMYPFSNHFAVRAQRAVSIYLVCPASGQVVPGPGRFKECNGALGWVGCKTPTLGTGSHHT